MDFRRTELLNDLGISVWFERRSPIAVSQSVEPFQLVGLGVPGALLLSDVLSRREDVMLANDILRSAIRSWQAKPQQRVFEWPQAGASGDPQGVLAAFVEKLVTDFDCAVLLVTESVMRRLQSSPIEPIVIPDLSKLTLPEDKLSLWRQLQTNRT